jgi:Universal stress protein family.
MWKNILVGIDKSEEAQTVLTVACELAKVRNSA